MAAALPRLGRPRLIVILILVVVLAALTLALRYGPGTPVGRDLLARAISGARVGDLGWLKVEGIAGDPWSDMTIARLTIADRQGEWLDARDVRVLWLADALLARRVKLRSVSAASVSLDRRPELLPSGPDTPPPVAVSVERANLHLILEPAFAFRRGDYLIEAAADIERDRSVRGRLRAVSVTHPGDFLRVGVNVGRRSVDVEAHALEAHGGALAGSLGLDADLPFGLDARVHGAPREGWFSLVTRVGDATPAVASGAWKPAGGQATARIDLAASRWLAPLGAGLGPSVEASLSATRLGGGLYHVALEAHGAKAGMAAAGDIDPARRRAGPRGVTLDARVASLSPLVRLPGLGGGRVTGRLTGDDRRWSIQGAASADSLDVAGYGLASVSGPLHIDSAAAGLTARFDGQGAGGRGSGAIAYLLGAAPRVSAEVDWLAGGRVLVKSLSVRGAALDLNGQGRRGLFGDLAFAGKAMVRNLAPRGGVLAGDWKATQRASDTPWAFSLHAVGQGFRSGAEDVDAALGARPELTADGRLDRGGALSLDHARLIAAAGAASGQGTLSPRGDIAGRIDWTGQGALAAGPVLALGASHATASLAGALAAPRLDLTAEFRTLRLGPGAPAGVVPSLEDARLTLALLADGPAMRGEVGLTGRDGTAPARAGAAFRILGEEIAVSDIDVEAGGASVRGGATLAGGRPRLADLTFALRPGRFIAAGQADGQASISGAGEAARATLRLTGSGLTMAGGGQSAGAVTIDTLTLAADGPLARLPYHLDAKGRASGVAFRLSGAGTASEAAGTADMTFAGSGRLGATDARTLEPASLALRPEGVEGVLHLAVAKGRADIALSAPVKGALKAKAVVAGLDIGLWDPDIQGRADGELDLTGLGADVVGSLRGRVAGLAARDSDVGAPMAGTVDATFGSGVVAIRAALSDAKGSRMSGDVRLPATLSLAPFQLAIESGRPMSGHVSIDGDAGALWDLVEGGGRTLGGHVTADGTIGGALADPRLTGSLTIDDGDLEDASVGLRLKAVTLRAAMKGDVVDVERFSATDGAKGQVSGSGRLSLLREGASSFRVALKDFRLIDTSLAQATASGAVDVDRAADGKVRLGGALTIDHAQISPTAPTPSGVVAMEVTEVHRAVDADAPVAAPVEREPPVALDITLKAPGGVFIKGRGLNLEMSLDAKVTGSTVNPDLSGVARVVRGDYDFAGKRFQIDDSGQVHLGSTLETVRLDITASRDDTNLTAIIKIGGTAAAPTLTLSSTPVLPKDEILSQVLFGASAAQLSGLQAAQLASAVAGLAGNGGFDVVGGLRSFAHLDRLAIDTTATAGYSVAGGKYVTDKIYVELSGGPRTGQGAQVEWRVRKHLSVVSRVTSQGDHAVSVRWRKDY